MKTVIYYSVENCGDGSAYPVFFLDQRLADFHQANLYEPWGEDCVGSLSIKHDGPIEIKGLQTIDDMVSSCWEKKKAKKLIKLIKDIIGSTGGAKEQSHLNNLIEKLEGCK